MARPTPALKSALKELSVQHRRWSAPSSSGTPRPSPDDDSFDPLPADQQAVLRGDNRSEDAVRFVWAQPESVIS